MIKYNLFHEVYFLRIKNIIMYLFILDFMQYWLHRVIHRTACLKTNFHNTHHIEKKLIPLDFIHVDIYEYLVFFLGIHVFIAIFLKISLYEFICSSLIIFAHQYYTHSDSNIDFLIPFFNSSIYHKKHHIIGKGNYAMFFPIWDFIMNTMITKTFKQHRNEIRI
jgi:sterol desaturase/sphingolipid hydroxylase (fatty acid hydroxylase superfamily)